MKQLTKQERALLLKRSKYYCGKTAMLLAMNRKDEEFAIVRISDNLHEDQVIEVPLEVLEELVKALR